MCAGNFLDQLGHRDCSGAPHALSVAARNAWRAPIKTREDLPTSAREMLRNGQDQTSESLEEARCTATRASKLGDFPWIDLTLDVFRFFCWLFCLLSLHLPSERDDSDFRGASGGPYFRINEKTLTRESAKEESCGTCLKDVSGQCFSHLRLHFTLKNLVVPHLDMSSGSVPLFSVSLLMRWHGDSPRCRAGPPNRHGVYIKSSRGCPNKVLVCIAMNVFAHLAWAAEMF